MEKTAYSLIQEADRKIKKKYRYFCGIVEDTEGLKAEDARLFFESPDGQDYEFYSFLIDLGFKNLASPTLPGRNRRQNGRGYGAIKKERL